MEEGEVWEGREERDEVEMRVEMREVSQCVSCLSEVIHVRVTSG